VILLDAAIALAARGYHVLPTGSDKRPLLKHGHQDASVDEATIAGWDWERAEGLAVVIPDRQFVVDVDPRNGGAETLEALFQLHGWFPRTRLVSTQSGGRHLYFALPDDREIRGKLGPGVDIKKPGRGYVLVPPSPGYRYLFGGSPALAPEWLLEELTVGRREGGSARAARFFPFMPGSSYGLVVLEEELEKLRGIAEGGGRRAALNASAFKLAGLVEGGELNEDRTLETLLKTATEDMGLEEDQALSRIHSGWHAGLAHPWGAPE
jgi:Bifunctional DNA primase/polymerase, N-terminal